MTKVNCQKEILDKLRDAVVNLDVESAKRASREALAAGISPYKAIMDGLAKGMEIVGERYESKEYFLGELIMAGEVMKEGMKILEPHIGSSNEDADSKNMGKVVIGTVQGDLHDIGKNIVVTLLKAAGFQVYDLGVDVSTEKFVEAVRMISQTYLRCLLY